MRTEAQKAGLFTSEEFTPARVARALLDQGIDYFRGYVCEHLGQPDERVTQAALADLAEMEFDLLNVLILVREPNRPDRVGRIGRRRLFGNPDDRFAQSQPKRALITQAEVRSIALAQLDVRATSVVWDIELDLAPSPLKPHNSPTKEWSSPWSPSPTIWR